jgi:hypothetical protein
VQAEETQQHMKLTSIQINEIAQDLESGMKVYLNKETLEFEAVPDLDDITDSELWDEIIEKIENEWKEVVIFEKLESREAFKIMENFLSEIDDQKLKETLFKILNRKSPFANFKYEIESSDYRQKWFDFRTLTYEEYLKTQLDLENIEYE